MNGLIIALIVGGIAGWLAGKIMRGSGYGLIGDIAIGVVGGWIGTWLWDALRLPLIANFWLSAIVTATVGAMIFIFLIGLFRRV